MEITPLAPVIAVDLKKHRIRINSSTLRRLKDPDYVRLLVNPEKRVIVVESCGEKERGAQRIVLRSKRHYSEVYSSALLEEISICAGFPRTGTFSLAGRQIRGRSAVLFSLNPPDGSPNENERKEVERG